MIKYLQYWWIFGNSAFKQLIIFLSLNKKTYSVYEDVIEKIIGKIKKYGYRIVIVKTFKVWVS